MFSLIITIISIALVAALALATLYYGGSAFNKGSAGATAARIINEGQQINGAVQLARADAAAGGVAVGVDLANLGSAYLAQLPSGWDGASTIASGKAVGSTAQTADVCNEVNKKAGYADAAVVNGATATTVFGCDTTTTKAFYKF
jgi:hypothetical protein